MNKLIIILLMLSSCETSIERLQNVGKAPTLNHVEAPQLQKDYRPVEWPVADNSHELQPKNANSLWQPGARTFFRDQRARRIGDILKIKIDIKDAANLNNETGHNRSVKENDSAPNLFGFENNLKKLFKGKFDPKTLLSIANNDQIVGSGKITRNEAIQTQIAAMVTQILPNGNLVIKGHQEVRVNYELREVAVEGIIRPEDISSDNSVNADQIAEARIAYGGRGQITNLQQPRIGMQVLDIISPF